MPQAHAPQGHPVQDGQGLALCAGKASLRQEAVRCVPARSPPPIRSPGLTQDGRGTGYGGQTKPVFHKKAKTTKKVVLRLECTSCKYKMQMALKRCKHFELGGDKKQKGQACVSLLRTWVSLAGMSLTGPPLRARVPQPYLLRYSLYCLCSATCVFSGMIPVAVPADLLGERGCWLHSLSVSCRSCEPRCACAGDSARATLHCFVRITSCPLEMAEEAAVGL